MTCYTNPSTTIIIIIISVRVRVRIRVRVRVKVSNISCHQIAINRFITREPTGVVVFGEGHVVGHEHRVS